MTNNHTDDFQNENEAPQDHQDQAEDVKRNPLLDEFIAHQRKAIDEAGKALDALIPEGFREHGKVARDEFVAGWKVVIDAAIESFEKVAKTTEDDQDQQPPSNSSTGNTKVKIQVD
jgi:hypothetical protein